jgi:hypothetical protein
VSGFWYDILHYGIEGILLMIGALLAWFCYQDYVLDKHIRKNERRNNKYL